ncbi:hypothetical protein PIROE2DRAFT_14599 [Piromyces sp. E2]|nr:hypothetical protein PIROE2DRAFT_14599 [Piromyces sp. E2]|eukprot:OUM59799.1 hypothetical protein PIROE2DRAFT_14599 [Piromyces sp. E2]
MFKKIQNILYKQGMDIDSNDTFSIKNVIGVANENGYHTKCPNCNTSFDVLPGTEGSIDDKEKDVNDDSDSTLSSHSSLAEIIDKVIASKNRKMKKIIYRMIR